MEIISKICTTLDRNARNVPGITNEILEKRIAFARQLVTSSREHTIETNIVIYGLHALVYSQVCGVEMYVKTINEGRRHPELWRQCELEAFENLMSDLTKWCAQLKEALCENTPSEVVVK